MAGAGDLGPGIYLRQDEGGPVPHRTRPCVHLTGMRDTVWWQFPAYFETLYSKTIVRDTPGSHLSCHGDLLMREWSSFKCGSVGDIETSQNGLPRGTIHQDECPMGLAHSIYIWG